MVPLWPTFFITSLKMTPSTYRPLWGCFPSQPPLFTAGNPGSPPPIFLPLSSLSFPSFFLKKCSPCNKLNFQGSISFFPIVEPWLISSRKYFPNHNWNAIIHNRKGRRGVIDLALVSGGRHVNDILYFLSLPWSAFLAGQVHRPLSPQAEPVLSLTHLQQPAGTFRNTTSTMSPYRFESHRTSPWWDCDGPGLYSSILRAGHTELVYSHECPWSLPSLSYPWAAAFSRNAFPLEHVRKTTSSLCYSPYLPALLKRPAPCLILAALALCLGRLNSWLPLCPVAQMIKNLPANAEMQETQSLIPGSGIPGTRKWQPTPVFLPRKSHWQRILAGYSSWGHKELDTTEQLTVSLTLSVSQ